MSAPTIRGLAGHFSSLPPGCQNFSHDACGQPFDITPYGW